jgi:pantothenate kinase type III
MQAGIFVAVAGGIAEAVRQYRRQARVPPAVYLTGGQAALLLEGMRQVGHDCADYRHRPTLTLEGVLAAAEGLP